jgi:hypothetical protein
MRRWRRIYRFALLGACGGLIAAALHQWLLVDILSRPLDLRQRNLYHVLLGLLIGIPIGFFPRFAEGLSHYSVRRAMRSGLIGAIMGGVGGAFAVFAGEYLHGQLHGRIAGRAAAFALLGFMVGLAEGIAGGAQWWRGVTGGVAGGIIAGTLTELLLSQPGIAIFALILLGLSISLFISLFTNVLLDAWLEGLPGSKVAGHIYQLSKFREPQEAILGESKSGEAFIWIPEAEERHAGIRLTRDGSILRHLAKDKETLVNGSPVSEHLLRDREEIELGSARLLYRERRGAAVSAPSVMNPVRPAQPLKKIKVLSKTV